MIEPIERATKLAQAAIEQQEGTSTQLVSWYIYGYTRHEIKVNVGIKTDAIGAFTVPVRVSLEDGKAELI
jgi:hypothetical protein